MRAATTTLRFAIRVRRYPRYLHWAMFEAMLISGMGSTFFTTPHIPSLVYLKQLTADWFDATRSVSWSCIRDSARYHYGSSLQTRILTQNPIVGVECSAAQNVSAGKPTPLLFPTKDHRYETRQIDVPQYSAQIPMGRFSWVDLNRTIWTDVTTGALFTFYPDDARGIYSHDALAISCTVKASWMSTHVTHRGYYGCAFTSNGLYGGTVRSLLVSRSFLEALTPVVSNENLDDYSPSILVPMRIFSNTTKSTTQATNSTLPNMIELLVAQAQVPRF